MKTYTFSIVCRTSTDTWERGFPSRWARRRAFSTAQNREFSIPAFALFFSLSAASPCICTRWFSISTFSLLLLFLANISMRFWEFSWKAFAFSDCCCSSSLFVQQQRENSTEKFLTFFLLSFESRIQFLAWLEIAPTHLLFSLSSYHKKIEYFNPKKWKGVKKFRKKGCTPEKAISREVRKFIAVKFVKVLCRKEIQPHTPSSVWNVSKVVVELFFKWNDDKLEKIYIIIISGNSESPTDNDNNFFLHSCEFVLMPFASHGCSRLHTKIFCSLIASSSRLIECAYYPSSENNASRPHLRSFLRVVVGCVVFAIWQNADAITTWKVTLPKKVRRSSKWKFMFDNIPIKAASRPKSCWDYNKFPSWLVY